MAWRINNNTSQINTLTSLQLEHLKMGLILESPSQILQ